MKPELILDRTEACRKLGISRQTLLSWIQKGKLAIWKRVGNGSNAALLFERKDIEALLQMGECASKEKKSHTLNGEMRPKIGAF